MDVTIKCPCPEKDGEARHADGDKIVLRDKLDHRTVTTIRKAMGMVDTDDPQVRMAERLAICTEFYMLMGIESWTLADEHGKPVVVSHLAIRERIFEADDVDVVSEAAEDLYNPVVLLPLVVRAANSSPPSQTPPPDEAPSTSQTSTPPRPLRPSKQSSTTTSPMVATETITSSSDGVSSSSQNSASAA